MSSLRYIVVVALLLCASSAAADSGALFGESARATSLADSVVARPGDTSAIYFNPAGVADIDRPTLVLLGHVGNQRYRFARTGEIGDSVDRDVTGYGFSIASPMPGPAWLHRVRLAASVHLPGQTIIGLSAPVRRDEPYSFYYGDRTERTAATFALAIQLPWTIHIGAAVTVTPTLIAPTRVGFDADRGETVDEGVFVHQDRDLRLEPAFIAGVRVQPCGELSFGLVWRQGGSTRASGDFDVRAGAIRVADEYRFNSLIAPMEFALGVAAQPWPFLSISLDATWARWSEFRTIHDEVPEPGFSDVIDLRAGVEYTLHRSLRVRAGYAFLPSPAPEQNGRHNLLDSDRHELAFGLGLDLESLVDFALRIDIAARFHVMHRQSASKAPAAFTGTIDNLGYPGFTSRGSFEQISLSLTLPLGETMSAESSQ